MQERGVCIEGEGNLDEIEREKISKGVYLRHIRSSHR